MNNRETVADVVAQMRGRGEDGRMDRRLWLDYADRIEAAWKRERAKVEADALAVGGIVEAARHKPVSSAAAMRDALLNIQEYAAAMDVDDGNVLAILDACRDALAAPARNCDLNLSAKSLWDKFEDYMNDCGLPFYSEPSGEDAFDWLFASATERKGEGDA